MLRRNTRLNERLSSHAAVALRWREISGESHFVRGKVVDYSTTGLRIELHQPIQPLANILIGAPGHNRTASSGKVRYCLPKRTKYVVGVELSAGGPDVASMLGNRRFSLLMFRP
jgi:PilZ domain